MHNHFSKLNFDIITQANNGDYHFTLATFNATPKENYMGMEAGKSYSMKGVDVVRIKAIREAVGNEIPLRIDANQGWSVDEAIATLQALGKYDIQHCEEPIPRWNFMQLPKVRQASPIPIMSDESCGDEHDAERLINLKACDYLNIKLGKSGGIHKALKMVKLAEAAALHLQVGAFMESRLAMTAFAHFSLCSPMIEHYDFDTALMFVEDPVTGGIIYEKNGVVKVPEVTGLGASVDEKWLSKMESIVL